MSDAVTEKLAGWMCDHSFATGQGDSMDDLLDELSWQVQGVRVNGMEAKRDIEPCLVRLARKDQLDRWCVGFVCHGVDIRHVITVDPKLPFVVQVADAFIKAAKDMKARAQMRECVETQTL